MKSFRIAAVQLTSTDDRAHNLGRIRSLVAAAAVDADLIVTPENSDQIAPRDVRIAQAEPLDGPFIAAMRELARDVRRPVVVGSFAEKAGTGRLHNTSVFLDESGEIVATYRKIHLFDATPADGIAYRESDAVTPGDTPVAVDGALARIGLSVCYDLRFPELYRRLAAEVLLVPSAFTVPTGEAHWEILLRARAIENQAYVVAPAQAGEHGHGRRSYGRSLIVDPWGRVLAEAPREGEAVLVAALDHEELARVRRMIPALQHRRITG